MKYSIRILFFISVIVAILALAIRARNRAISIREDLSKTKELRELFFCLAMDIARYNSNTGNGEGLCANGLVPVVKAVPPYALRDRNAIGAAMHNSYAVFLDGFDLWGNEILLFKRDDMNWVIRSRGPNGIDDRGSGDDIEAVFNVKDGYLLPKSS